MPRESIQTPQTETDRRKRQLQKDVLQFLLEQGPLSDYDALYVQFDPHMTGEILPVLQELRAEECIELQSDRRLILTEKGKKRLENWDVRH